MREMVSKTVGTGRATGKQDLSGRSGDLEMAMDIV
jgi:hypothetical protein